MTRALTGAWCDAGWCHVFDLVLPQPLSLLPPSSSPSEGETAEAELRYHFGDKVLSNESEKEKALVKLKKFRETQAPEALTGSEYVM